MRALCIIAVGLSAIGLPACDKKPAPGSCYRPQDNICVDYGPDQGAAGKRLCAGMTWTPGAASCKSDGRLGSCTQKDNAQLYYSGAPNNYSAASAKSACEHANGAWSP